MKTYIIVLLSFFILAACKPEAKDGKKTQDPVSQKAKPETVKKAGEKNTTEPVSAEPLPECYEEFPKSLDAENNRYVDSNKIMHVDLLGKDIPQSDSKSTVDDMFPGCKVAYNNKSTDFFDVFDVKCNGELYTAVVSYETNLDNEHVIGFIYVRDEAFSMKMIEQLFNE